MLDELQGRVDALDAHLDAVAVATTLDDLLAHGHGALRRERTDPLIGLVGAQLVELVAGPVLGTAGVRPIDDARAAGFARLRALRRLVLREETSDAYLRTAQLAPFVRTRAARHEGAQPGAAVDRDLAAQLISLGLMSALCEWSMLLGDDTPSAEVLRLR